LDGGFDLAGGELLLVGEVGEGGVGEEGERMVGEGGRGEGGAY